MSMFIATALALYAKKTYFKHSGFASSTTYAQALF